MPTICSFLSFNKENDYKFKKNDIVFCKVDDKVYRIVRVSQRRTRTLPWEKKDTIYCGVDIQKNNPPDCNLNQRYLVKYK